jgi:hexosaminidase
MNRIRTIVPAIVLLCSSYTTGAQVINVLPRPACITVQQGTYHTPSPLTFCTNARGIDSRVFASLLPDGAKRTRSARKAAVTLTINHKQGPAEGYLLRVTQNNVSIEAPAAEGLFYGLQTLRQLIGPDGNIPCVSIADSARFPYRGIMIDVSRHFFSKDFILKQIDAMSAFKLNRLHLHLTDAAGWRLQINSYPLLTRKGAFRSSKGWKKWWFDDGRRYKTEGEPDAFGGYYTQADIREIVDYARQHFITVIPEVEMPAHSEEVMNAYPQLGCLNADSTMETAKPRADFCPGNEDVFVFWRNVLKEIAALFPSPYIHIGGDEAARTAWRTCPRCKALMQRTGMKDVDELQSYFHPPHRHHRQLFG